MIGPELPAQKKPTYKGNDGLEAVQVQMKDGVEAER
jgi:hypothetical protein